MRSGVRASTQFLGRAPSRRSDTLEVTTKPTRLMMATLAMLAVVAGVCTMYYRVKDTTSGRTNYTEEIHRRNGTVIFRDTKSGSEVTLPSSEIAEVPKEEYKKNTGK